MIVDFRRYESQKRNRNKKPFKEATMLLRIHVEGLDVPTETRNEPISLRKKRVGHDPVQLDSSTAEPISARDLNTAGVGRASNARTLEGRTVLPTRANWFIAIARHLKHVGGITCEAKGKKLKRARKH